MGFLVKRSVPKAIARWIDNFNRPDENPVRQPWGYATGGFTGSGSRIKGGQLEQDAGYFASFNATSFEYQPFTSYWGVEFDFFANQQGVQALQFMIFLGKSWPKQQGGFNNSIAIRLFYRGVGQTNPASLYTVKDIVQFDQEIAVANLPGGENWWRSPHRLRIWVDNDVVVRFWVDDILMWTGKLGGTYKIGPDARSANFNNQLMVKSQIGAYELYDRQPDHLGRWNLSTPLFADDFDRADNVNPGNGWIRTGNQDASILSGAWGVTGTNGGVRHLIQTDTLLPASGDWRIEHQFSTNPNDINTAILVRGNDANTLGLAVVFKSRSIGIARLGGSSASPSYTVLKNQTINVSVPAGSVVGALLIGDELYGTINGEIMIGISGVAAISPATNRRWGIMTARGFFPNSARIDQVRLYDRAA